MRKKINVYLLPLFLSILLYPADSFADLKFTGGPSLKIRHEHWKNIMDLADPVDASNRDNRDFFRIKTSLWGQADLDESNSLYAKLSNENRPYTYFEGTSPSFPDKQPGKKGYHYDINEVYFENLYWNIKDFGNWPVDVRIGRQDFAGQYGEGFLILDGTPVDGPRSLYFNAAKTSWRVNEKNTLDLIYINDTRTDQLLPVINRTKLRSYTTGYKVDANYLTTTDEQGYVLYWKNQAVKDLALEGYYIFKRESQEGGAGIYSSEKTLLNTMGSFAKYSFAPYTLRAQAAGQWGSYGRQDRTGLGGYIYLDRELKEIKHWSPTASLGYLYLSGDDRKTSKQEGWDPLFSQYPWISSLYMYTLTRETGIPAYWTNLHGPRTFVTVKPTSKCKVILTYIYLRAVESVPRSANVMFSGNSKDRGQIFQSQLDYSLNKNTVVSFLVEYFMPGRFYANDDSAVFLKTELAIKF